jgi:hypothetical protein
MCLRILTLKNVLLILALIALSVLANAQTESTVYTFSETTSFWPQGALLEDSAGNLFGTTRGGGTYGVGTVMELSPPSVSGGAWTLTTLYSFIPYGSGGYVPMSDLVRDQAGAFYGTFLPAATPPATAEAFISSSLPPKAAAPGPNRCFTPSREIPTDVFPCRRRPLP